LVWIRAAGPVALGRGNLMDQIGSDITGGAPAPGNDVIGVLLEQHERIKELFAVVQKSTGDDKQQAFNQLRALLAAHEAGEEIVLRPISRKVAGDDVTEALNNEEAAATKVLADLENLDIAGVAFDEKLAVFAQAVSDHAEHEEREEFPTVRAQCPLEQREKMAESLMQAEKLIPTHAHPMLPGSTAAQWAPGPFAAHLDRAHDAYKR
jgi:hemerythrin superfamily protein